MRPSLIALCLAAASSSLAFEGRLLDSSGQPVAGAIVVIAGETGSRSTDAQGRFSWSPDPATPFEMVIELGDGGLRGPIRVAALAPGQELEVELPAAMGAELTITSPAAPGIEAPPASALASFPQSSIRERKAARVADVVASLPGGGRQSDRHSSIPSLRGLARGRTLLVLDGGRVTSERRAGPDAAFLDPFFLESIEVARGPGGVAYGSDAFGGIVHARTPQPTPGDPFEVRAVASLGEGLPEARAGVELRAGYEKGAGLFQARSRSYDDYRSPRGRVPNSQAQDDGFLLRWAHELGGGLATIGWQSNLARDIGRPTLRNRLISVPTDDSHRLSGDYGLQESMGFERVALNAFVGGIRRVTEQTDFGDPAAPRTERSDVSAKDYGVRALGVRTLGAARLELGLDVNGRTDLETDDSQTVLGVTNEQSSIADASRQDWGGYVRLESPLHERLRANLGMRVDRVRSENQAGFFGDRSTSEGALSGHAALTAVIDEGLDATLQVSRGFRDPTLSDRYFRGVSGRGFVTGNPDLKPETAFQLDGAVRWSGQGRSLAFYAYRYRIDDLIERFEGEDNQFFFRNRSKGTLRGVELELRTRLFESYALELGAQAAKGTSDSDPLDDVPSESVWVELGRELGGRARVHGRATLFARDEDPGPSEIVVPGFATVDVGASLDLSHGLSLAFAARNLLDKAYPQSPDGDSVLAPGIEAAVTLEASLF